MSRTIDQHADLCSHRKEDLYGLLQEHVGLFHDAPYQKAQMIIVPFDDIIISSTDLNHLGVDASYFHAGLALVVALDVSWN